MTRQPTIVLLNRLLFATWVALQAVSITHAQTVLRKGDWIVKGNEACRAETIRLEGNLVLPAGSKLTLEDCSLEIVGQYSREHLVEWEGGTLVTRHCTVGGFINPSGTAIHTVFHLYKGNWEATDTTVQYSYGISFHWKEGRGVLRGRRLKAGPRPDAIILSGEADVELVDSDFPIGLGVYVDKGGETTLDLTPNTSVSTTYDRSSLLPGVNWRLDLKNTRVPRWFLFLRNIGMHHEAANIRLSGSKDLIVSLLGHNLTGALKLSNDLQEPLRIGNVSLMAKGGPAGISMYAIYLSGDETHVSLSGQSHICELMHRGGKLRVTGTNGRRDISIGCTTLDLSGNAELDLHDVHLGRPLSWQTESSIGEATIANGAALTGDGVSIRDVRFRTEDMGRVDLNRVTRFGRIEKEVRGGPVLIREVPNESTTRPRRDGPDRLKSGR